MDAAVSTYCHITQNVMPLQYVCLNEVKKCAVDMPYADR